MNQSTENVQSTILRIQIQKKNTGACNEHAETFHHPYLENVHNQKSRKEQQWSLQSIKPNMQKKVLEFNRDIHQFISRSFN